MFSRNKAVNKKLDVELVKVLCFIKEVVGKKIKYLNKYFDDKNQLKLDLINSRIKRIDELMSNMADIFVC